MHVMHAIDAISERIIFILLYLELSRIEGNKVQVESVEILKRTTHDGGGKESGVRSQKSGEGQGTTDHGPQKELEFRSQESEVRRKHEKMNERNKQLD